MYLKMPSFIQRLTNRSRGQRQRREENIYEEPSGAMVKMTDKDLSDMEALLKQIEAFYPAELNLSGQRPCPKEEDVWRFVSHEMKGKERRLYEKHLVKCDTCRVLLAEVVRQNPVFTQQQEGSMLTQPPSLEALAPKGSKNPKDTVVQHPGHRRKYWPWGFGLAAPAAVAACLFFLFVFTGSKVNMVVHLDRGDAVRSTRSAPLKSGDVLEKGDSFRAEITSRKDGFVYFYLWSASQEGEFLFPSPSIPQDNRVHRGAHLFVPAEGLWVVDETEKEEETLYLLYSESIIDFDQLSEISRELWKNSTPRALTEEILARHFSIEQKITYRQR